MTKEAGALACAALTWVYIAFMAPFDWWPFSWRARVRAGVEFVPVAVGLLAGAGLVVWGSRDPDS